ncbi:phosphotyrosine protein phosphatase [Stenotrophomonas panacihumi]|uniref:protein-tyrosine-phosphatase n=1 Tax=Stenotrophomonas panacihumi TaxID=676599 RepID=A0A0R0B3A0_9GAMM|nr:low molecular weight protein-tyrosine-phosphatase [Stenotrophomonas panacihumi]KRG47395.1 phosphotyrosine protein phosphatase [Stenotrophomonas panacihumi]PTN55873.1 low molecular weight phosphotyrosine protein phosphatase [Stenotrophomonas panacihumi]
MRLLVLCLGNICRSPMGEGALRARLDDSPLAGAVEVDSAGTGGWHAGEPPDRRAIRCAAGHGVDISGLRARQLRRADFQAFDWILCADEANLRDARTLAPAGLRERVVLWLPWAGIDDAREVPDPYTGGTAEFEAAWDLVNRAALATVERLTHAPALGIIDR